ncbi:MAG: hypothetical protein ACYDEJ_15200 [Desulfitobacteriaceae bacterium]
MIKEMAGRLISSTGLIFLLSPIVAGAFSISSEISNMENYLCRESSLQRIFFAY